MGSSLDVLFRPRSIAVIGASRSRGTVGGDLFHNLLNHEFNGPVYPVNRGSPEVQSVRAYPTVADVPGEVDLAIVAVPKAGVIDVVHECGKKGVKAVVVISAGFGEVGPAGAAAQEELVRAVRRYGMRLVGPNCLGVLNTDPAVHMDAAFGEGWPPEGNVSFSSQSGALGLAMLDYARDIEVGIRHFISVGNKADVSGNDLLEYWEQDPSTRVILLYLESFGNPRRFLQIARRVSRNKPIIMVKSGRSTAGARAASSHTGALAGREVAVDALLTQAGVIRTASLEELFDVAQLVTNQPIPTGPRVAILTNAGGPAIMAADACEGRGLKLPALSDGTMRALREILPRDATVRNPVDLIAGATAESYESSLPLLLGDASIDAVMVLFIPTGSASALEVAKVVVGARDYATKPILTCFMGTRAVEPARAVLHEAKIPTYAFPESAAAALAAAASYGAWRSREESDSVQVEAGSSTRARISVLSAPRKGDSGTRWLSPEEIASVLGAYAIATAKSVVAKTAEEAATAAATIGYPVALKLVSDTITHKTDVGGVHLGLADSGAVRAAFASIEQRLTALGKRNEMRGALVQAMAPAGVETMIGVTQDASVGPIIGFGLGGTLVEVLGDVVFRVVPITGADASDMIERIRGVKLLDGFRGAPPADRAAIVDALLRVSRLVEDMPEIVEIDINPLIALAPGKGVVAVDARILVRS